MKSLLPQGAYAPHVHPRLRKRLARCTLDCGSKTSESPALRGFVGERAPIRGTSLYLVLKSNGLRHSKNPPVKFSFSLKIVPATIAKKLPLQTLSQTVSHRDFQLLSQTAHVRSHSRKRVHTRLSAKNRTQRLTRRNRGPSLPRPQHGLVPSAKFLLVLHAFIYIHFPVLCGPHYQQQLYLRPSFIAFFNFSHKWPTFAFTSESEYTLGFLRKIAHNGTHAETGAFRTGPLSLPSERSARSQTSPGRVSERRTLPLLGLGRGCSRRTRRACGAAMRLRASLLRGVAAPLGCAALFATW